MRSNIFYLPCILLSTSLYAAEPTAAQSTRDGISSFLEQKKTELINTFEAAKGKVQNFGNYAQTVRKYFANIDEERDQYKATLLKKLETISTTSNLADFHKTMIIEEKKSQESTFFNHNKDLQKNLLEIETKRTEIMKNLTELATQVNEARQSVIDLEANNGLDELDKESQTVEIKTKISNLEEQGSKANIELAGVDAKRKILKNNYAQEAFYNHSKLYMHNLRTLQVFREISTELEAKMDTLNPEHPEDLKKLQDLAAKRKAVSEQAALYHRRINMQEGFFLKKYGKSAWTQFMWPIIEKGMLGNLKLGFFSQMSQETRDSMRALNPSMLPTDEELKQASVRKTLEDSANVGTDILKNQFSVKTNLDSAAEIGTDMLKNPEIAKIYNTKSKHLLDNETANYEELSKFDADLRGVHVKFFKDVQTKDTVLSQKIQELEKEHQETRAKFREQVEKVKAEQDKGIFDPKSQQELSELTAKIHMSFDKLKVIRGFSAVGTHIYDSEGRLAQFKERTDLVSEELIKQELDKVDANSDKYKKRFEQPLPAEHEPLKTLDKVVGTAQQHAKAIDTTVASNAEQGKMKQLIEHKTQVQQVQKIAEDLKEELDSKPSHDSAAHATYDRKLVEKNITQSLQHIDEKLFSTKEQFKQNVDATTTPLKANPQNIDGRKTLHEFLQDRQSEAPKENLLSHNLQTLQKIGDFIDERQKYLKGTISKSIASEKQLHEEVKKIVQTTLTSPEVQKHLDVHSQLQQVIDQARGSGILPESQHIQHSEAVKEVHAIAKIHVA
jgi:hypothetical protein